MSSSLLDQDLALTQAAATPQEDEERGFVRLPLRSLQAGELLSFDIFLKCRGPRWEEAQFILACQAGAIFREHWQERLRELEIHHVYYRIEKETQVLAFLAGALDDRLADDQEGLEEKLALVYDATRTWVRHFFTEEKARSAPW